MARVLILSDCHLPWQHPRAFDFFRSVRDKYKPTRIISIGDFFDLHSFSRWPTHPDLPGPGPELDLAIEAAEEWYDEFDEFDIVESNHDSRILKKALGAGLPSRVLRRFEEIMRMPPGWKVHDFGIEIDGVLYIHGDGLNASSSKTAYNRFKQSVVHGHLHQGLGVNYSQTRKERYFSLNTGCMIDMRQKAFDYARFTHERATIGCGLVIDGDEAVALPMPNKLQISFK